MHAPKDILGLSGFPLAPKLRYLYRVQISARITHAMAHKLLEDFIKMTYFDKISEFFQILNVGYFGIFEWA